MISQAVKNFISNNREDLDNNIDRFLSNGLLELDENGFMQLCRVLLASGISEILSFPIVSNLMRRNTVNLDKDEDDVWAKYL